jgi:DNA-binding NtrC family response regulator
MVNALDERKKKADTKDDLTGGIRFLAGTTSDLAPLVKQGLFSANLYAHLTSSHLRVKSLRERKDDILPLAFHLLRNLTAPGKAPPRLMPCAQEAMASYSWPGNISELSMSLHHAWEAAKSRDNTITRDTLPSSVAKTGSTDPHPIPRGLQARALKQYLRQRLASAKKT